MRGPAFNFDFGGGVGLGRKGISIFEEAVRGCSYI